MSGGLPKIFPSTVKDEPLNKRPELSKPNPDIIAKLPIRKEIRVIGSLKKDLEPLARVFKKFQIAGQPTLSFEVDDYTADAPQFNLIGYDEEYKREVIQCCLHEFMHMALWDDVSISHSPDKESLLYYFVDGSVNLPNEWDKAVIKDAATRIGVITIELRELKEYNIFEYLKYAADVWNLYVGREFFKLI